MDKQLWTGVLVGVVATFLVLGGLVTAGATAMGMGGGMGVDGMMDECREMMQDHGHGHDGGHDHGTNDSNEAESTNTSRGDGSSTHAVAPATAR